MGNAFFIEINRIFSSCCERNKDVMGKKTPGEVTIGCVTVEDISLKPFPILEEVVIDKHIDSPHPYYDEADDEVNSTEFNSAYSTQAVSPVELFDDVFIPEFDMIDVWEEEAKIMDREFAVKLCDVMDLEDVIREKILRQEFLKKLRDVNEEISLREYFHKLQDINEEFRLQDFDHKKILSNKNINLYELKLAISHMNVDPYKRNLLSVIKSWSMNWDIIN